MKKISNIKRKNLILAPDKYLRISINEEYQNINFAVLLNFIDKYAPKRKNISDDMQVIYEYGNAYAYIRQKTNELLGIGRTPLHYIRTSKREIKSILFHTQSWTGAKYIKIPYKISYIFAAIIEIVKEIQINFHVELPENLKDTFNCTYGLAFYAYHIDVYDDCYNRILHKRNESELGYFMKSELNNDFHSENSIFRTIVKR